MEKHSKSSHAIIGILIVLLTLFIVGLTYWIYSSNQSSKFTNSLSENLTNNTSNIILNTTQNIVLENTIGNTSFESSSSDLFATYYDKAEQLMKTMSLEEQVSQMFIARCPEKDATTLAQKEQPGGFILFGRDFKEKTKSQVLNAISSYQKASKIPMIIGTDEEGGSVVRISSNRNLSSKTYSSPQTIYKANGFTGIKNDAIAKSKLLLDLGINVNFAPVCDVSTNSKDFIYKRAFGKNATQTAIYVETVVNAMNSQKIGSVLKHFPGYGNNIDTHTDVSHDNRSLESFKNSDFIPFQKGIDTKAPMVLVSHNIVACMDKTNPASLSSNVHQILREDLNFTGLIITDDLAMDAITKYANISDAAIMAVQAGNDLILTSDFKTQKTAVINAVNSGQISKDSIHSSVKRILAYKYKMGLL